jgi:hypothetical protein
MRFTTLIPTHFNNANEVPEHQLRRFMYQLIRKFGGCSDEGITKGHWIDPADAVYYYDECHRVSVVCDRIQLEDARKAVLRIGQALGKRAMYFEVRDYDGVQFLEVPPRKR